MSSEESAADFIWRLGDLTFGLLIWIAHFLAIYIISASSCAFGWAGGDGALKIKVALTGLTLFAAGLIGVHALRHVRRWRENPDDDFLSSLTLGVDGVSATAAGIQVIPLLTTTLCV